MIPIEGYFAIIFAVGLAICLIIVAATSSKQEVGPKEKEPPRSPGFWQGVKVCFECGEELTTDQIYSGTNVCPYCGYASPILCKHKIKARRKIYLPDGSWEWEYK